MKARAPTDPIKLLIWLYAFLWLTEGAFRKWIPALNGPMFVIRDPIALWIYVLAIRRKVLYWDKIVGICALLLVALLIISVANKEVNNWLIYLFGIRTYLLHLPLIFVIGRACDEEDVKAMGRAFLLMALPMLAIVVIQFISGPGAWINTAAGGEGLATQQDGGIGRVRPAGLFSYASGLTVYLALATSFSLAAIMTEKGKRLIVAALGGACVLVMCALSINRAALLQMAVVAMVAIVVSLRERVSRRRALLTALGGLVLCAILANVSVVQEGFEAFRERWLTASRDQGDSFNDAITFRFLDSFIHFADYVKDVPLGGYGPGLGTNVGAFLMTGGTGFLLEEDEWSRTVLECGPIVGIGIVIFRIYIAWMVTSVVWRDFLQGRRLAVILWPPTFISILIGQWGPPVTLGATILLAGLTLAATKPRRASFSLPRRSPVGHGLIRA